VIKPPRMTIRQLMFTVAIVALFLSPAVLGRAPDHVDFRTWALSMALTNIPPIIVLPFLFRLDFVRSLIAVGAFAGIATAQLVVRSPANLNAVIGYIVIAAIAQRARNPYDLLSAIASIAAGVLIGVACGYNPCAPIEIFLAPLTGMIVRLASVKWLAARGIVPGRNRRLPAWLRLQNTPARASNG
jgi:hypothetical protein